MLKPTAEDVSRCAWQLMRLIQEAFQTILHANVFKHVPQTQTTSRTIQPDDAYFSVQRTHLPLQITPHVVVSAFAHRLHLIFTVTCQQEDVLINVQSWSRHMQTM